MDPSRRSILGVGLFSAAAVIPGWPDVRDRLERVQADPHTRVGHSEVQAIISMTEHISDLDDKFGGRMARPLAAAFLVNTIVPALKATAPDDVKNALRSAAADHCYLTGYMAMDERQDGLAQQYYTKALELAGSAGDHLTYCTTLRGMSVQAVDLGHGSLAVRLADAAASASPQAGPRMLAFLAGQQAHAAAQTGDRTGALLRSEGVRVLRPVVAELSHRAGPIRAGRCRRFDRVAHRSGPAAGTGLPPDPGPLQRDAGGAETPDRAP
ncbi:hypothetical protein ACWGFX_26780 [Streptomyces xanthophaeus]